mmetsp:Transcript_60875/g.163333  ORF Transcript_60875/g.163333 Transcript_60875/m.163333 type:complete len:229 (-) Transcript_60875:683-1369(-)
MQSENAGGGPPGPGSSARSSSLPLSDGTASETSGTRWSAVVKTRAAAATASAHVSELGVWTARRVGGSVALCGLMSREDDDDSVSNSTSDSVQLAVRSGDGCAALPRCSMQRSRTHFATRPCATATPGTKISKTFGNRSANSEILTRMNNSRALASLILHGAVAEGKYELGIILAVFRDACDTGAEPRLSRSTSTNARTNLASSPLAPTKSVICRSDSPGGTKVTGPA